MIAKLETTLKYTTKQGPNTNPSQNNRATINIESTIPESPPYNAQSKSRGGGGGLKLILLPNIGHIYCSCQKIIKLAWRLTYLSYVSSRGNNRIYKHNVKKHRKVLSTQSGILKISSWATVGPAKDKHHFLFLSIRIFGRSYHRRRHHIKKNDV